MANPISSELLLPLLPDARVYSYPKKIDKAPSVTYFPLSEILTKAWTTDAHFTAYSAPERPYRLSRDVVTLEGGVVMVLFVADCDCELAHAATGGQGNVPAPDEWWLGELPKLEALQKEFPGAFIYRTRGGYRTVYLLPIPIHLDSPQAVNHWKATYLAWCVALRRRFGIYADPSCHDWQRLFRAPHATRIPGGRSEQRETRGNPELIGVWTLEPTDEEQADAWLIAKRPRAPRDSGRESTSAMPIGDGVLFHAFSARGWVGHQVEPGKWAVQCPWESSHSKGTLFDTSTVLFAPGTGETLGWWHCSHAHCQRRDLRDVLALFGDTELDQAKTAAGILPPLRVVLSPVTVSQAPQASKTLADVVGTFQQWLHLPDLGPLLAYLGTIAANRMAGDPVWMMLIGGPGWGKTETLLSASQLPNMHIAATLTEASLLSGTRQREKSPEAKGGLLKQIGPFGFLVLKDFTSILSMNRDLRTGLLAALREIYDGSWTRHVGVDGGLTLAWKGKLALIGGCTGTIDRYHAVIGAMGERFVFYRWPHVDERAQAKKALKLLGKEATMRRELASMVNDFFAGLTLPETPAELSDPEQDRLIALATLVVRCRSAVERDSYSRDIELIPDAEAPGRLTLTLARLYAGLRAITVPDSQAWALILKIGFDCLPALRWSVLKYLLLREDEDWPETAEIAAALGYPTQTTRRTLEDLAAHGVLIRSKGNKADRWAISDWTYELHRAATTAP